MTFEKKKKYYSTKPKDISSKKMLAKVPWGDILFTIKVQITIKDREIEICVNSR